MTGGLGLIRGLGFWMYWFWSSEFRVLGAGFRGASFRVWGFG